MTNETYLDSPGGRLFASTAGLAVAGAGIVAILGPGYGLYSSMWVTLVVACLAIPSVGLSVMTHPARALALTIALPLLGGIYYSGTRGLAEAGPISGVMLVLLGAAAILLALTRHLRIIKQHHREARAV